MRYSHEISGLRTFLLTLGWVLAAFFAIAGFSDLDRLGKTAVLWRENG